MITRITKFKIASDNLGSFKQFMHQFKDELISVDGCKHLDILQDSKKQNYFFILMIWIDLESLENFRKSELNKVFTKKIENWCESEISNWTVENVFDPEVEKQQPKLF